MNFTHVLSNGISIIFFFDKPYYSIKRPFTGLSILFIPKALQLLKGHYHVNIFATRYYNYTVIKISVVSWNFKRGYSFKRKIIATLL